MAAVQALGFRAPRVQPVSDSGLGEGLNLKPRTPMSAQGREEEAQQNTLNEAVIDHLPQSLEARAYSHLLARIGQIIEIRNAPLTPQDQ